jgi:hypothetical protein
VKRDPDDVCKQVLETMQRVQTQPSQGKVQYIDDFTEDINVLAEKLDHDHQKESFRNSQI